MAEQVSAKQGWEAKEITTLVVCYKLRCSLGQGSRGCVRWARCARYVTVGMSGECGEVGKTCPSERGSCRVALTNCCCVGITYPVLPDVLIFPKKPEIQIFRKENVATTIIYIYVYWGGERESPRWY